MSASPCEKTALVTGASGFVGSHLVDELCRRGYRVRCFIRPTSSTEWLNGRDVELFRGTFDTYDPLYAAAESAEYVFHVGGTVRSIYPEDFHRINAQGTRKAAQAVKEASPQLKRFIYISSLSAGGAARQRSVPLTEDDIPAPISIYGKSKHDGEIILRNEYSSLPVTTIRPPLIYGPRDRSTFMIMRMMKRRFCPMPLRLENISVIYVKDLVRGIADAAESPEAEGKTYYLSDANPYTMKAFLAEVSKHFDREPVYIPIPYPLAWVSALASELYARLTKKPALFERQKLQEAVQKHWICSPAAARKDFNFTCRYTLEEAMRETMEWYANRGWLV